MAAATATAPEWRVAQPTGTPPTQLGEGALWSVSDQCLYWIDIERCRLHRFTPAPVAAKAASSTDSAAAATAVAGEHASVLFGSMIGCLALTEQRGQILLAAASGLWLFDWATLRAWLVSPFPAPSSGLPADFRFNDGAVSPRGSLIVGTLMLDESVGAGRGSLYEYACSDSGEVVAHTLLNDLSIPNGIDWNNRGDRMLFIDTPTQRVDMFDSSPSAAASPASSASVLSNRRPALTVPKEHSYPDGMTMDAEDCFWIAHWDGARVTRWSLPSEAASSSGTGTGAEAKLLRVIELPTRLITCPCFGGPDLRDLYLTSASRGVDMQAYPLAGSLFVIPNAGQGRPQNLFRGRIKVDDSKAVQFALEKQD